MNWIKETKEESRQKALKALEKAKEIEKLRNTKK